jgi:hypothetical protein
MLPEKQVGLQAIVLFIFMNALQRHEPYMAHKGRCNTFNLLHNFRLKSIPI